MQTPRPHLLCLSTWLTDHALRNAPKPKMRWGFLSSLHCYFRCTFLDHALCMYVHVCMYVNVKLHVCICVHTHTYMTYMYYSFMSFMFNYNGTKKVLVFFLHDHFTHFLREIVCIESIFVQLNETHCGTVHHVVCTCHVCIPCIL